MTTICEAAPIPADLSEDERRRLTSFANGTLDPAGFHHRDHVRLAWLVLRTQPLTRALEVFTAGLRRLAAAAGRPERYHETITWALLLLINERREADGEVGAWESFAARHPELLEWPSPLLRALYREETLDSDLARRTFVLPDRGV